MKSILQSIKKLLSFKILFLILIILNSLPILLFSYYPSLDGPVHIYNTNLLREIILFNNDSINQFFTLNAEIIPNWTSHFVLFILRLVFSSSIADKILLLLIAFSLPITIYNLIDRIAPHNIKFSVFSLPFVYTFLFGLGFYNFCLGVIVFLITLSYWINRKNRISIYSIIGLFGLLLASYFTHILVFILTYASIGLFSLLDLIHNLNHKANYRRSLIEILIIILTGLPTLIFTYSYISIWNVPDISTRLPLNELIKWIVDVRSLIIHNYVAEVKFSRLIFFTAIGLFLYLITKYTLKKDKKLNSIKLNSPKFFFGLLTIIFLILYLIFPDSSSGGSYITVRLNIMFYLLFFIWLSTFKFPAYLLKIGILIILLSTTGLLYRNYLGLARYENLVKNFKEAEEFISENSIILPIRNSGWMLDPHFPHYLGWNTPVVILENFEASTGYYPLVWNRDELPLILLGDSIITNVCLYEKFPASSRPTAQIEYIITWGTEEMNECKQDLWNIINQHYIQVYYNENSDVQLYKLKASR